jgi:ribonuclease HI
VPKRRKKKIARQYHQSPGALPSKLADKFDGKILVFSDASKKIHAGIAAILFASNSCAPLVFSATTPMLGSNELELEAVLFALRMAFFKFPDRNIALFSDNQDAVARLTNAQQHGIDSDPVLSNRFSELKIHGSLNQVSINWIKSHAYCRGNTLADQFARDAANGSSSSPSAAKLGEFLQLRL